MLERIAKFFIVVLFVGLAAFAIYLIVEGGAKSPATQPVTPLVKPTPAPTPAPAPIVAKDYADAIAQALLTKRKIFLYVGASWCVPCQQMQAQTLADASVKAELAKYVTLNLDFDSNKRLARSLKATDLPSYLLVDADRTVLLRGTGFKSVADFLAWIKG